MMLRLLNRLNKLINKIEINIICIFLLKGGKMESIKKNYLKCGVKIIAILAFFSLSDKPIYAGIRIPDFLRKCVLAIGTKDYNYNESTGEQSVNRRFIGTGVLIRADRYILVTAKHVVFDDDGKVVPNLCFWGNKRNGEAFTRSFSEIQKKYGKIKWVPHPDPVIDIAVSIVELDPGKEDLTFVNLTGFEKTKDIEIGDDVYYLGYPSGIGTTQASNPVLRRGMIAHKEKDSKFFYIDAVVSGGNSGGPVFLYQPGKEVKLLGIVSAFEPFISGDIRFYHSGLGRVFSADCIEELLDSKTFKDTIVY